MPEYLRLSLIRTGDIKTAARQKVRMPSWRNLDRGCVMMGCTIYDRLGTRDRWLVTGVLCPLTAVNVCCRGWLVCSGLIDCSTDGAQTRPWLQSIPIPIPIPIPIHFHPHPLADEQQPFWIGTWALNWAVSGGRSSLHLTHSATRIKFTWADRSERWMVNNRQSNAHHPSSPVPQFPSSRLPVISGRSVRLRGHFSSAMGPDIDWASIWASIVS